MPGLGTKLTPDYMRFEVVFEVVMSIPDIRYPRSNGARYGPGLPLFGEIVMPGRTKLRIPAHGFGISPKISLFLQNTANYRLKNKRSQTRLEGKSPTICNNVAGCGKAGKTGGFGHPVIVPPDPETPQNIHPDLPNLTSNFPSRKAVWH